ncbi:MAG: DUF2065 domain-containing protein [Gammaproteobacteria bacterium]|nr:DUF2065 domain-containing protein [Gammaproteobacteria bacterium]
MSDELLGAFALFLVFEGLLPFASPGLFRQTMMQMSEMSDSALRLTGLGAMILGVVLLYAFR